VGLVAQAVIVISISQSVICWTAKPGKEKGIVGKKKHLIIDLLEAKAVLSIFFYE